MAKKKSKKKSAAQKIKGVAGAKRGGGRKSRSKNKINVGLGR